MFVDFFYDLRNMKIPVTIREYLMLLEAMEKGICDGNADDFYYLARSALVKDERYFDRFDQAFGSFFRGLERKSAEFFDSAIPDTWLRALTQRVFSEEEMEKLEKLGFEDLMEELQKRLEEKNVSELILATSTTIEGEATAHYVHQLASNIDIKVSRIAFGIPLNGELGYLDSETISHAFNERKVI